MKDLEQTRERRHVLKKYYSKIKKVLSDTQEISLQEEADFVKRAKKCNKDLNTKKFTVLVAGKLSEILRVSFFPMFTHGFEDYHFYNIL